MAWDGTRACMPTWSLPTMPHLRLPSFPPGPTHCYIPTYSLPTMSCLLLLSPNETLPPCAAPWWLPAWILSTMPCPLLYLCIAGFHAAVPGYPYAENSHYATQYHRVPIKHAAVLPSTSVSWYWAFLQCHVALMYSYRVCLPCPAHRHLPRLPLLHPHVTMLMLPFPLCRERRKSHHSPDILNLGTLNSLAFLRNRNKKRNRSSN